LARIIEDSTIPGIGGSALEVQGKGNLGHSNQFSIWRPGICWKCLVVPVMRMLPEAMATAAIWRSAGAIGIVEGLAPGADPFFVILLLISRIVQYTLPRRRRKEPCLL
jgi:hypothetical protein